MKRTKSREGKGARRQERRRRVRLRFRAPEAKMVCVAGTFNDWQAGATPLQAEGDGSWSVELELEPGSYEYRYVVDSCWVCDPNAAATVANPFGGKNGLFRVSEDEPHESFEN